jgi:hypothetical protein
MNEIMNEIIEREVFEEMFENTKPTFEGVKIPKGYSKDDVFAIKPVLGAECLVWLDEKGISDGWYRGVIKTSDDFAKTHGMDKFLNVDLGGGSVMNMSLVYLDNFSIASRD